MKKYITVREVAEMFGVHQETVYRWLREGKLKYIRIGHIYHIDPESLEQPTSPNPH